MVAQAVTCPECGGGIPSDARTLGLCPRCLLSSIAEPDAVARRSGLGGAGVGRFTAPDVDDLAGEFPRLEVLEFLGQGGMGAVYRALQTDLGREVALKIIPTAGIKDPAFGERFGREARALASLSHPNVVTAYEFGRSRRFDYLLMELVRGPSLREVLQAGGVPRRLGPRAAIQIVRQLGDALDYAHRRGVTHRDIKPENILLEPPAGDALPETLGGTSLPAAPATPLTPVLPNPDSLDAFFDRGGRVRVVDFGLAKLRVPDSAAFSLTATDQRLGTGVYMAPEQLEGRREVDARADVYAVGVVLYEMLTGELPIGRFPPPSRTPGVSRRLDPIVWRCLEKDPDRRYRDVASLCQDLGGVDTSFRRPLIIAAAAAVVVVGLAVAAGVVVARHASHSTVASLPAPNLPTSPPAPAAQSQPPAPSIRPATPPTTRDLTPPAEPLASPATPMDRFGPAGPAFPPPPGFHRPGFANTPDQWHQNFVNQHGAQRVVTVWVDGLPGNVSPYICRRLGQLSGSGNQFSSGSADSLTVELAPVSDIQALAAKIDFGTVRSIDPTRRVIEVVADPSKLPPPLPPEVKDVRQPDFYPRNIEDLGSWDPSRRHESLRRLKDTPPDPAFRPQVTQALRKVLGDAEAAVRKDAVDALVIWAGPDAVPPLIDLLKDADHGVRQRAAEALGKSGDVRAAEPLAQLLATDRHLAGEGLKALGPAAEPAVRARLQDSDPDVRKEAARLLGTVGTADSLPALQEAAASHESFLAMSARSAIQAIQRRAQKGPTTAPR